MTLSEALSLLAVEYPEGCAEYFGRMKPDPWQAAHDELEKHIKEPEELLNAAVDRFYSELQNLQASYKVSGVKAKPLPWNSAMNSPSLGAAKERWAKVDHRCADCMTDKGLGPLKTENGFIPICSPCKKARAVATQPGLGI